MAHWHIQADGILTVY
jgi:26S proteasome regulatory subunit N7